MTLIAHSINFRVPFIVGDLLLSGNEKIPFTPPTVFVDASQYLDEPGRNYFPSELAQKIYVVAPRLAVALSGSVYEMIEFLKELRHICKVYDNTIKQDHIHQYLRDYDLRANFGNSSFYMMLVEHTDQNSIFVSEFNFGNWNNAESDVYEEISANGSGAKGFNEWANAPMKFISSHEKGEIWYAIQSNVCLMAKLMAIERSTLGTIKRNWGAGFELMFYDGTTFIKFDQVAYLIFEAQFDEAGNIGEPILTKAIYYKYKGEILKIVSIDIGKAEYREENSMLQIKGTSLRVGIYPVYPIDLGLTKNQDELSSNISFQTERVSAALIITKNKESLYIPAFFNEGPELKVEFQQGESFEVSMMVEIMSRIRTHSKEAYPNI